MGWVGFPDTSTSWCCLNTHAQIYTDSEIQLLHNLQIISTKQKMMSNKLNRETLNGISLYTPLGTVPRSRALNANTNWRRYKSTQFSQWITSRPHMHTHTCPDCRKAVKDICFPNQFLTLLEGCRPQAVISLLLLSLHHLLHITSYCWQSHC